ncbi:hypothetical protein HDK77DRAFT_506252 [Phyllosticta capitalensis]
MSYAWTIACRPFAGLRLSALPPCAIARSIAARSASTASCCSSTTPSALRLPRLQSHNPIAPPPLRFVACRYFSTTPSVAKKARKSSSRAAAESENAKSEQPKQPQQDSKQDKETEEDTPLPSGALSDAQITSIFGPDIPAAQGNAILRSLHHRRVTGSLVEKGVQFDYFPPEKALKGLEYLRATHPLDEQAAAAEYAEAEAERLENELVERAQKVGLYKKDPVYGYSELEALRARNEAVYEAQQQQKRREEEQKEKEAIAAGKSSGKALEKSKGRFELRRPPKKQESEFTKYYRERGTITHDAAPPEMSYIRRVGPSVLLCLAICTLCYLFASTYTPPSRTARIWPDTPPALSTNLFILSLNLLAFLAWKVPPAWRTMNKYFIMTPGYPHAASILGSIFSHSAPAHLLTNMFLMMVFGPYLHDLVGRGNYLAIFVGGGAIGATASLLRHAATPRGWLTSSLGASGALNAVVGAYFILADAERRRVPFTDYEVPLQGKAILAILVLFELVGMRRASNRDHVAHLAGMATGAGAAVLLRRRVERAREEKNARGEETGAASEGAAMVAQAHHGKGDLMVDWEAIKARVPYWMGGTKR